MAILIAAQATLLAFIGQAILTISLLPQSGQHTGSKTIPFPATK
jgi:hypothetical protein